uniref:Cysteine protease n=1 Tax=Tetraodon nigroviridis TaxID=99883 RepID=H3DL66_TETNG
DEVEKLKTKFMSVWNNVKYIGWALKPKTSFSRNSPVLLLGKCYHFKVEGNVEDFRRDFGSRIWLTYREEFPPLPGSTLTSDCGWGCMLRAGQMMLAQALLLHFMGRDWTWSRTMSLQPSSLQGSPGPSDNRGPQNQAAGSAEEAGAHVEGEAFHRTLVSWFGDSPSAQFGLHRMVHLGLEMGKQAGEWYGPAVVAHILKKAVEEALDPSLAGITAYVSQDCTVYSADVIDGHKASTSASPESRAVIILVPVRLGGEKTNPDYFNLAKSILSLDYCIGIIGGKPKQACYFVGFQDDSLIYMDPHYCQSFVDVSTSDFPLQSFHCPSPKKMPFTKMDPSCTLGFYSRSAQDFEKIKQELTKLLQPSSKEKYPAFIFVQGHSQDYDLSASLSPDKREWPFIRDPRKSTTTVGDFVLL